jgi:hypothetical protein
MRNLASLWRELFPVEQCRLAQLLIERVVIADGGLEIIWRDQGWQELAGELLPGTIGAELQEWGRWRKPYEAESAATGRPIARERRDGGQVKLSTFIPLKIRKRGGSKVVVRPDGAARRAGQGRQPDRPAPAGGADAGLLLAAIA